LVPESSSSRKNSILAERTQFVSPQRRQGRETLAKTLKNPTMAIDRILWKNPIKVIDLPNWICPTCKIGFLKGKEKDFNIQSDSHSIKSREHPDWEPYWIKGVFNGALKCNNNKCLETVVLLGEMVVHEEQYYIEEYDDVDYSCVEVLKPKIFFPPLEIFPISESIPLEIKIALLDSFYLFFTDNSSCAIKSELLWN
jgi:hypothetical protein